MYSDTGGYGGYNAGGGYGPRDNYALIQAARTASFNKNYFEAVRLFRQAFRSGPLTAKEEESFAWSIYFALKQLSTARPLNVGLYKQYLFYYLQLRQVVKPSMLNTLILVYADKLYVQDGFNFAAFLRLFDLSTLQAEDRHPRPYEGKLYPSLHEKVVRHAAKALLSRPAAAKPEDIAYLLQIIPETYSVCMEGNKIWLDYYQAKLLVHSSQADKAAANALKVAREKPQEFWIWALLGDIYEKSDARLSLACYCKACTVNARSEFLTRVKVSFAAALQAQGYTDSACYELDEVAAIIAVLGTKKFAAFTQLTQQPWYKPNTVKEPDKELYARLQAEADDLLLSDIPWCKATLGKPRKVTTKEGRNKTRRLVYLDDGSGVPLEISIPDKKEYAAMGKGAAVSLRYETKTIEGKEKTVVYGMKPREGTAWDVFVDLVAVVTYINQDKKVFSFLVSKDIQGSCTLPDNFEMSVLQALEVMVSKRPNSKPEPGGHSKHGGDDRWRYNLAQWRKTDKEPAAGIMLHFDDTRPISMCNGYGFLDIDGHDVFIPPEICQAYDIDEGTLLTGTAALNYDRKKERWGYRVMVVTGTAAPY